MSDPIVMVQAFAELRYGVVVHMRENSVKYGHNLFLPEVRELIKDTRPKTNTTRGGRKAHRPTPKTRTIHPTVLPDR